MDKGPRSAALVTDARWRRRRQRRQGGCRDGGPDRLVRPRTVRGPRPGRCRSRLAP